jgi:hypothetical protein
MSFLFTNTTTDDEELGLTFSRRFYLPKLNVEKALVMILPLACPPQKCACFLGAMPPPLPSMEIHYDYNFTKKKAKHHLHIQETNNFKTQG